MYSGLLMRGKDKGADMTIKYDSVRGGYIIVYDANNFISRAMWGKPVNKKVYESWASACHDLDKWAS